MDEWQAPIAMIDSSRSQGGRVLREREREKYEGGEREGRRRGDGGRGRAKT